MKAFYVLPLLLTLVSCKYNSLDKIVSAANIDVKAPANAYSQTCLQKQLSKLDSDIYFQKKKVQAQIKELLEQRIRTIVLLQDKVTQVKKGVVSTFSYVTRECYSSSCWYKEQATKKLLDETTVEGTPAQMKITLEGDTLTIQAEKEVDLTVVKKYYTRSVETYDVLESLEQTLRDPNVWNEPTASGDKSNCANVLSLKQLLTLIETQS